MSTSSDLGKRRWNLATSSAVVEFCLCTFIINNIICILAWQVTSTRWKHLVCKPVKDLIIPKKPDPSESTFLKFIHLIKQLSCSVFFIEICLLSRVATDLENLEKSENLQVPGKV